MSHYYLSLILFTPLAGALILLLVNKENVSAIKWIANIVAFVGGDAGTVVVDLYAEPARLACPADRDA